MIYSNYLFKKTLIGFAAITGILISLIWFSRAITFVKYVTENGVELSQFFYLFILILPWLLLFIIPFSLFGTILFIYNKFIVSNEITILKNSGLTKFEISRPALYLATLATVFCFLLSFFIMPYANKQLRLSRTNFQDNYASLAFNPQTFETLKELTIYAHDRDKNNQLFGILLHDERSLEYSVTITAETGRIVIENKSVLLHMEEGTLQKSDYKTRKTEILNFDNYVFNLSENQKGATARRWKPKEQYLHELLDHPDAPEKEKGKYRSELNQRFTQPLLPIVFALIGLSCILRGSFSRRGNLKNIILAMALATTFLSITLASYGLIESSISYIPILYINIIAFIMICFKVMNDNYRKKK